MAEASRDSIRARGSRLSNKGHDAGVRGSLTEARGSVTSARASLTASEKIFSEIDADETSSEGSSAEAVVPVSVISELLEHISITLRDPTGEEVPYEPSFKIRQHNSAVIEEFMDCDCEVEYTGPESEDVVLRVFTGFDPRRAASFQYVGHIHAMQAEERCLRVRAKGLTYSLGIELHRGLNQEVFEKKSIEEVFHEDAALARDPQGLSCATSCDFLVVFGCRDSQRNTAWIRQLEGRGPRSGPWGHESRSLHLCTDWSLGMGRHFGTDVEIQLGRHGFGQPQADLSTSAWFEELLSAARLTRYGVLIVNVTPAYFRSRACNQELLGADWARLFVYAHLEDIVISADDYARQLAQAPHPILPASRKGNYLEVVESLRNDVDAYQVADADGNTPLALNAMSGETDSIHQMLNAGAEPDERNHFGVTALHHAVVSGHLHVVEQLIGVRADVDGRDDYLGLTALHQAARLGRTHIITLLLEKRADGTLRDNKGHTALAHAMLQERMDIAQLLQDAGYWKA